jgi:hypothetical protein
VIDRAIITSINATALAMLSGSRMLLMSIGILPSP